MHRPQRGALKTMTTPLIHPTALVDPAAELDSSVSVGPYAVIGPHVRIGFANKPIVENRDVPVDEWDMYACFSLVHYVFPNISISGHPGNSLMVSRLVPGPTVGECTVVQYQYFRERLEDPAAIAAAEVKRQKYADVTLLEDFMTVMRLGKNARALAGDVFRFGRNEVGNQNLHRWLADLVAQL